jgi:NAD(P)-dependent dehydrogenase (short-subunit alcohol dehydrogenase family)
VRALVTGASRGIGRAIAVALAARGAQLALVARDAQALARVSAELDGAQTFAVELGDTPRLAGLVDDAAQALGGLDAVINAAGVVRYAAACDVSRAQLELQHAVNFLAPVAISQAAATRWLRDAQRGVIVNVASTLAFAPAPLTAAYAATKAALIAWTRSCALELGPAGIRVNAVAPGVIDTDMVRVARPGVSGSVEEQLEALRQRHLVGRLGTPEDVALAVLYLLDADFVTGSVLVVDGGLTLA